MVVAITSQSGVATLCTRSFEMGIRFFEYMQQPRYWLAYDETGYWLVPAKSHGWHEREPFIGHVTNLIPLTHFDGIDLDLPDEEKTY